MLVLGLESSCDETAAALVSGRTVLAETVRSQVDLHRKYGGVVPEIASRAHLEAVDIIVRETLDKAGVGLCDLGGLAVTQGPGLVGALLVAINFAKGLSLATGLPATGVNHVKAHALAPFLRDGSSEGILEADFPLVALVASGGHTSLFLMEDWVVFRPLGQTLDDAAGEAFDKSAKLMGLGYPGGRVIEELAAGGDSQAFAMTRPMLRDGLDFSFSGLKTRVSDIYRRLDLDRVPADDQSLKDLAASFQAAAVDVMAHKLRAAATAHRARGAVLSGGVAANRALRKKAAEEMASLGLPLYAARPSWCADNGAMIAFLGGLQLSRGLNILGPDAEALPRWKAEA
jgi:N6-L-threonylcarbamoyladenine synthase